MNIIERIIEQLKSMPESDQAEVLGFFEYLKSKKGRNEEDIGVNGSDHLPRTSSI